jgi:hypothetical protein
MEIPDGLLQDSEQGLVDKDSDIRINMILIQMFLQYQHVHDNLYRDLAMAFQLSGGELRAEVLANYFRHERLPDCTFLPENALYQRTYGTLPEGGVIIQQSHKRSQAARSFAA